MSTADEIAKLAALRDAGEMSPGEFEWEKARLLGMPAPAQAPLSETSGMPAATTTYTHPCRECGAPISNAINVRVCPKCRLAANQSEPTAPASASSSTTSETPSTTHPCSECGTPLRDTDTAICSACRSKHLGESRDVAASQAKPAGFRGWLNSSVGPKVYGAMTTKPKPVKPPRQEPHPVSKTIGIVAAMVILFAVGTIVIANLKVGVGAFFVILGVFVVIELAQVGRIVKVWTGRP
jgi:DNA-directed RNA polymerase subunit RPC12/RpoP